MNPLLKDFILLSVFTLVLIYAFFVAYQLLNDNPVSEAFSLFKPQNELEALREIHADNTPLDPTRAHTDAEILSWAIKAAEETMTFSHAGHLDSFQRASRHFTKTGWHNISNEFHYKVLLPSSFKEGSAYQAYYDPDKRKATIEEKEEGRWIVRFPLRLTLTRDGFVHEDVWDVLLTVVESTEAPNEEGLGIEQWIAAPLR